ncbi:MAG: AAA family ATPase [Pseudomonadota bacterium]|nr:AAA family ATPase [Pseudomonadota bacterium]MDE3037096.1 AAA family ATPase [Pseudomonadota bacterium]
MTLNNENACTAADKTWTKPNPGEHRLISLTSLMRMEFPEPKWIVPNTIPDGGCVILAGPPKVGKSWFVLDLALGVATGGMVMGKISVEKGGVIYYALEDTLRRLQSRLKLLDATKEQDNLFFETRVPTLDQGGLEMISADLKANPGVRLIIVDTLQKVRGPTQGSGKTYELDYALITKLKQLADDSGVTIIVVHHVKKAEEADFIATVSGSFGLTGAADTILVLGRKRGDADGVLQITGRDVEESSIALKFDKTTMRWLLLGNAEEYSRSKQRQAILNLLLTAKSPMMPKEIADTLRENRDNVRQLLFKMVEKGEVQRNANGKYSLPDSSDNGDNTDNAPHATNGNKDDI